MLQSTAEIYDEVSSELDETITTDDFNEDKTVAGTNIILKLMFKIKNLIISYHRKILHKILHKTVNFLFNPCIVDDSGIQAVSKLTQFFETAFIA